MDLLAPLLWLLMILDTLAISERERDRERSQGGRPSERYKEGKNRQSGVERLLTNLLHKKNYAKSDPPMLDSPTEVKLGIYVNSFYSISEQTMDYSISFYMRQAWNDPRLKFQPFMAFGLGNVTKVSLGRDRWNEIWIPDVFFRNEKEAYFHKVTVGNRMLTLNYQGDLWYVTKISATLSCPMKLQKYPLDTQHCPMMFESFGYTMDTMYFSWLNSPVDIDPNVQLPQFTLKDEILYDCSQNYTAGAFPCLQITFILHRDIGFFLIQVYVPTILIVILSWVSFWINVDAIPARVSLGLLTVLTMTTMSTGANSSLPKVSYIKAIDVWMSTCLLFVFSALVEFAFVNVISRKGVRNPVRRSRPPIQKFDREGHLDQTEKSSCCSCINIVENGTERQNAPGPVKAGDPEGKNKARRIDKVSRKMFPMAFLLFNIIYWIVYTLPGTVPQGSA